jgi:hypothetical protein
MELDQMLAKGGRFTLQRAAYRIYRQQDTVAHDHSYEISPCPLNPCFSARLLLLQAQLNILQNNYFCLK